jgi:putative Holliday junction resolvase
LRALSIDLGDKRTGLAVGDDVSGVVSPLAVLEQPLRDGDDRLLDAIAQHIRDYSPDALVLGLPLNMDGTEGPRAKIVRTFAARLGARVTARIDFQDERLTSADAEWSLAGSGKTHKQKKQTRDALAAAAILRDYFGSSR